MRYNLRTAAFSNNVSEHENQGFGFCLYLNVFRMHLETQMLRLDRNQNVKLIVKERITE